MHTFVDMVINAIGANTAAVTWSRVDVIIPWCKEAMLAFPILRPQQTKITVAGSANHIHELPADFREIISVEHPADQEPPEYLQRLNQFDPSFYSSDLSYDVDRNYPDGTGWLLITSEEVAVNDTIVINYLANHDTDLDDDNLHFLTVPDEFLHILVADVSCKAYRERLASYMQDPTAHTSIIAQMYEMVQHAEARHTELLNAAITKLTDSRRLPAMKTDKYDRLY